MGEYIERIGLIARHEMLSGFKEHRSIVAIAMLAVLSVTGVWLGWQEYIARRTDEGAFAIRERQRWLEQGTHSPHAGAHHGVYVFQPQGALSAIEQGITGWFGAVVFLEAHHRNFFRFPPVEDRGTPHRFGQLSIAALIEILLPLVIVAYAYGAIARDRETGILPMLMAQGTRPAYLLVGKMIGVLTIVGIAFFPAIVLSAVLGWQYSQMIPLVKIAAVYTGYLIQIIAIVIIISTVSKSMPRALLFCILFWLWNCAVAPRLGVSIAAVLNPAPDALEIQAAATEEVTDRPTLWDRREQLNQRFLREYGVSSIKDLPVNPDGILLLEQEEQDTRASASGVERVYSDHRKQERLFRWMGIIAPSIAMQSLSMALAGTDLYHAHRFAQKAEEYRRNLVHQMNWSTTYDRSLRLGTINPYAEALDVEADRKLWEKVPPFRYEPPAFLDVVRDNADAVILYLAWMAATPLMLAFVSSRFYRFVR